jgi:integration host factor subunit beta
MHTVTKRELVVRVAEQTKTTQAIVKEVVQKFLDEMTNELGQGNRLEFRDFGVFEIRDRKKRVGLNPKTLEQVEVPAYRTVRFKVGRLMKVKLQKSMTAAPK